MGGDPPARYDILNWVIHPNNTITKKQVGSFHFSAPQGQQLRIKDNDILWAINFTQVPRSKCSESCAPGSRKMPRQGEPKCCYDCVACAEGEVAPNIDMENCLQCPADQWSNEKKDKCIPRTIDYLSYEDVLGVSLAIVAVIFTIATAGILGIFIKHRDTPIVKANNRHLSYVLLVSLMLCFLCSFLFIGYPQKVTCLLRQATFGVIFTVAVSSVLAKTITVVLAFNATKPNSSLRKCVGPGVSFGFIVLCCLVEVLICAVWLSSSPPFPEYDTWTEPRKMILQCNEGSTIAFYSLIGYMGCLALLSFIVAFVARKLPDSFNEAQFITFSMVVFCSVWLSFLPAYLSVKGKYMVSVELFAILSSAAGLLGCIFLPKCYIIVWRPDLNTRGNVIGKQNYTLKL
ncbi:vomeronasal type-2 receptor 26-like [Ambystoma mexicanum]|uniref:vomeronasal type-2 receptor 26-like n=1 Tax=Ambystoma mexicanum TaxID=8296 RepID=UPI0037E832EA